MPTKDNPDNGGLSLGAGAFAALFSPYLRLPSSTNEGLVIVGVGNRLRGDDGLGPSLIDRLKERGFAHCVDAGPAPENHVSAVLQKDPKTILLVDATHLGLPPGACRLLTQQDILRTGITTHDIPLPLLIDYMAERSGARILLLAIQPQHTTVGADLSPAVRRTLDELAVFFAGG